MAGVTEHCPWCGHIISRAKFEEIQARIREDERKKLDAAKTALRRELEEKHRQAFAAEKRAAEKRARKDADKKMAAITAERDTNAKKLKMLEAREGRIKKQAERDSESRVRKEVARQREILEKDRDQSLRKQLAAFGRERESYQKKIQELDRKLQRKTANELGDGDEIDLFEALRDQFLSFGDQINRVPKGQAGADVLHEVMYKGQGCGRIIIDSKNRKQWRDDFVAKLRADQIEAKADHAILSTTFFPSGTKELCIRDGIIIVNPARVPYIVELLRGAMIRMRTLGLSLDQRAGKMSQLYRYMTSQEYAQRFSELGHLADQLMELDVEETNQHKDTWKKRGIMLVKLKNVHRGIDTGVSAILEGADALEAVPVGMENLSIRPEQRPA